MRRAPRVTSRNNKIARSASSGHSASPHPPLRSDHPRTPASIFTPAKKSSVSWWLSHHPRALFPTANPIPRAPSFCGKPPSPLREPSPRFSSLSPFREPTREVPGCCSRKQRRSCRGKIIYTRQNSAGEEGPRCGHHLRKVVGTWGEFTRRNSADILRGIFARDLANVISRPTGIEGVIYEHETAESKRKRDRETLETTGGAEYWNRSRQFLRLPFRNGPWI